jgi:hypothetical protein
MLSNFLPVPAEGLKRDFAAGVTQQEICARSVFALLERGVTNVYISNLPMTTGVEVLGQIENRLNAELTDNSVNKRG